MYFIIRLEHLYMKCDPKLTKINLYCFTHFINGFGLALGIQENFFFLHAFMSHQIWSAAAIILIVFYALANKN